MIDPEVEHKICLWLTDEYTCLSSRFMARTFIGSKDENDDPYHPRDPADFGRCHRFLEKIPELRIYLPMLKSKSDVWSNLVDHWDECTAMYLEELSSGMAPKLYNFMKSLGC